MNKEMLCAAFCNELETRQTPAGIAVKTGFSFVDGDPVGFYVIRNPNDPQMLRIEDSGLLVPFIEASGINLKKGHRAQMFREMLDEYGAECDAETGEIVSAYMPERDIAAASLKFVALLLRLQDLKQWTQEAVESTLKEDAKRAIVSTFKDKADASVTY